MKTIIDYISQSYLSLDLLKKGESEIEKLSRLILLTLAKNNQIFICGNGGSSAQAAHFSGELIATFEKKKRRGFKIFDLHSCIPALTAWSNDFDYGTFLERQINNQGKKNDLLIILSTSGGSEKKDHSINLIKAAKIANKKKIKIISLLGNNGGDIKKYSDYFVNIRMNSTPHIQDAHMIILHYFCKKIDLFFK
jgi:D-sedoheptulose 7-phosphate isomerase